LNQENEFMRYIPMVRLKTGSAFLCLLTALSFAIAQGAGAQARHVDVYTAEQLASSGRSDGLPPAIATTGAGIVQRYPNHYTMLITRHGDGQSELHEHLADVFVVVAGEAVLWTGGSMLDGKATDPGERRGTGLSGATSVSLKTGDIVHIPANVPHQLKMTTGTTFTYFVVKVTDEGGGPGTTAVSR
jgi:mannose-6-phosphate isomerase-like protein (cupin superfamily)